MSRIRTAYTAGEAIGPDLFTFFRSLGINIKQLYGMTEAAVFLCMQPDGEVKPDTVGKPIREVEIKIAENGEVLYRGPGVFAGYYRNDQATGETKRPDGWVHSGDAGFFGDDGHLRIIDRAKDVGKLNDGTLFAPKFIENKLKFFSAIKEAVAFGAERDFATAMIAVDPEAVGNWAEKRGIATGSYQELAAHDAVYALVAECIAKVNRDLAAEPHLSGSQIRRFMILHKELDADDGELTRTRKVRRRIVGERFKPLVDALYSGATTARIGEPILEAQAISLAFGGVKALSEVSLEIRAGEVLAIIGPNGAGKTSMLNVINGFYHPQQGVIVFKGQARRRMRPHAAAAQGIARTFQNVALFRGMTTLDNLMTGRLLRMKRGFLWQALHWGPAETEELANRALVERIIDFLEIQAIRKVPVGQLPYGLQKRVESTTSSAPPSR